MSKPKSTPTEYPEFFIDDESLGLTHHDYERSRGRQAVRQGIDDYFDRKQLADIEDWFGSISND